MTDLDLSRDLDDCFGGEPSGPAVAHYVARGRRHVRRRRAGAALAVAGVAAGLATGFTLIAPEPEAGGVPATSDTSGPATPSPTAQTDYDWPKDDRGLARIHGYAVDDRGGLVLGTDVEVLDRVDLPAGVGHADRSYGLDLVRDGEEMWVYAPWRRPDNGVTPSPTDQVVAPVAGTTFRAWLDDVVAAQKPPKSDPDAVDTLEQLSEALKSLDVDGHGRVTLNPGAQILERVDNPLDLAAPYESAALRVRYRGTESWWLVSPGVGNPQVATEVSGTFAAWVQAQLTQGPTFSASGPMPPIAKIVDGIPEVLPDVEVLHQVDNPLDLAAPARSLAYEARLADGTEWWFLWELGPSGYFGAETNRAAGDGYPTFDAWLADQRSQVRW